VSTALVDMDIASIGHAYAQGETSPSEVLTALLERIEGIDPEVRAFTRVRADAATKEAAASDTRHRDRAPLGPLDGVPVGIKDVIDVARTPITFGSRIFGTRTPQRDADVVAALKRVGAVIVGITMTHEFAWGMTTQNPWWGDTRNPWNHDYVPGGSSGGSAAAVAAREVPLALGTDGGGSVRNPANFCGVVGIKPTYGAMSAHGTLAFAPSLDHVGLIGRSARDILLAVEVLAPNAIDTDGTQGRFELDLLGARIGVAPDAHRPPPAREIQEIFDRALDTMADLGARIVEITPTWLPPSEIYGPIQLRESLAVHEAMGTYPGRSDEYGPDVLERLQLAPDVSDVEILNAIRDRQQLTCAMAEVFKRVDVVASPASATGPAQRDASEVVVDGRTMMFRESVLNYLVGANLTGLPALVTCAGFTPGSLPVGIHLTAPWWRERDLLLVASALEAALEYPGRARPEERMAR
jgi:aspartyl-tRNA(Asn)/glutamyl-tRNA(Gln) amidotransferase subunit A